MALQNRLRAAEQKLGAVSAGLEARHPRVLINLHRQETTGLARRLSRSQESLAQRWKQRIDAIHAQLKALSPAAVLRRGYSMTTRADGRLIRSAGDVRQGDRLLTRLSDGLLKSIAQNSAQLELFEPGAGEEG